MRIIWIPLISGGEMIHRADSSLLLRTLPIFHRICLCHAYFAARPGTRRLSDHAPNRRRDAHHSSLVIFSPAARVSPWAHLGQAFHRILPNNEFRIFHLPHAAGTGQIDHKFRHQWYRLRSYAIHMIRPVSRGSEKGENQWRVRGCWCAKLHLLSSPSCQLLTILTPPFAVSVRNSQPNANTLEFLRCRR